MSLIDLYIKENVGDFGQTRRIGEDPNDQLTIDNEGRLRYYNYQSGDGCLLGEKGGFYEFVSNEDENGRNCDPQSLNKNKCDPYCGYYDNGCIRRGGCYKPEVCSVIGGPYDCEGCEHFGERRCEKGGK